MLDAFARRESKKTPVSYCRYLWPEEPPPEHSELLLYYLHQVELRKIKRLMVFMPPGHAKSTYASVRFPSWYFGKHPTHNLIHIGHTVTLVKRFGRRIRNTLKEPKYQRTFDIGLAGDSQDRGDWATSRGGEYFACGMDGGVTGRRADGLLIDDPIKSRKDADSLTIRDNAWETYRGDLRTRLKKSAWIVLIQTRWHEDDLAGRILPEEWNGESGFVKARDGEEWFVLSLPAFAEKNDILGRLPGEPLWPDWQSKAALEQERKSQGTRNWNALYQQHPTTEEGAILKAAYWREWPLETPPMCDFVLQSWDTAFEEGEENDCSARTTWGIFDWEAQDASKLPSALLKKPPDQRYNAIVLDRWMEKVQYPELKKEARQAIRDFKPDKVVIEKKSSGHVLLQDLRRAGVPVKAFSPDRSKLTRAHAAAAVFQQRCVWHMNRQWASKLIRNCAQFPNGEYDDDVDTVTQAILYFRRMFHLQLPDDEEEPDGPPPRKRKKFYG